MSKKRKIDKINDLERSHYPFTERNEVEEKYFQIIQKKNKENIKIKVKG